MKSTDIRKNFLDFFESKKHTIKPSSPLIPPPSDPTLLFITAGMVQFKPLWSGADLPFKRAASVQKCIRAGGKGSDLENVGKTLRHHTFFEMLGNFSFGDYFKKEAIEWSWEFINDVMKLSKENIWVSVYQDDDEAYDIWKKKIGLPEDRIVRLGDKDNFWGPAGLTGACGPSSEIYYDLGPSYGCGNEDCRPGCDCERYLEFWNLVFPQFYQNEDGTRDPLERKGIDTGMGLERLAFLAQKDAKNNYETDLFKPIVDKIKTFTKTAYSGEDKSSFHVIADHIRALTFAISENIMPSNEGRGYVLRRLLRRAVRHGRKIKITEPFLYKLVDSVIDIMKGTYFELIENTEQVTAVVKNEEERFQHTLDYGLYMLDEIVKKLNKENKKVISGKDVFKFYDTYGFPIDLMQELAEENSLSLDLESFDKLMKEQKEKARASWGGADKAKVSPVYEQIQKEHKEQEFDGYKKQKLTSNIIALIQDGKRKKEIKAKEKGIICLEKTPFYPESGGQVSDTGIIACPGGEAEVRNAKQVLPGVIIHEVKVKSGNFREGDSVDAVINEKRRKQIARHHSATHLLQYALRYVLGDHVKQYGSLVAAEKLRFDFTHFANLEPDEILRIETLVNEKIMEDSNVDTFEMPLQDALNKGVLAFFGEKYKDVVRLLNIGGFSKELCGGTHAESTGEIGLFRIVSEGSVAAGVRRIEAVCGTEAIDLVNKERDSINQINNLLKSEQKNVIPRIISLVEENKAIQKQYNDTLFNTKKDSYIKEIKKDKVQTINGIKCFIKKEKNINMDCLRNLGDILINEIKSGIIILSSTTNDKVNLLVLVTEDLTKKNYHAGNILKEIAKIIGGTGGGKPYMAQGGGKKPELLDKALDQIPKIVKKVD